MTTRRSTSVAVAVAAAVTTAATLRLLDRRPPGGRGRWTRTNFRSREVDLLAGPAAGAGAVVTGLCVAAAGDPGAAVVAGAATALGLYDDLAGDTHARGLRGHLNALREGRITSGLVKMGGLAAAGLLAAGLRPTGKRRPADLAVDSALVSGTANLVNLLDLRPGRALKAVVLLAAPLAARSRSLAAPAAGGAVATAVVLLPDDLGERRMVGDCGANALGALLGWSLTHTSGRSRAGALAIVVALTLVSERISFSSVIADTPALRALDSWGRAS